MPKSPCSSTQSKAYVVELVFRIHRYVITCDKGYASARWDVKRHVITSTVPASSSLALSLSLVISPSLCRLTMAASSYLAQPNVAFSSPSSSPSSNKLSSSIFGNVSLKKTPITHHFLRNQPLYLTSRTLTIKAMAPPKPAGKAKKGKQLLLAYRLLGIIEWF